MSTHTHTHTRMITIEFRAARCGSDPKNSISIWEKKNQIKITVAAQRTRFDFMYYHHSTIRRWCVVENNGKTVCHQKAKTEQKQERKKK